MGFGVVHLLRFVSWLYNHHFQTPSRKPESSPPLFFGIKSRPWCPVELQVLSKRSSEESSQMNQEQNGRRATIRFSLGYIMGCLNWIDL